MVIISYMQGEKSNIFTKSPLTKHPTLQDTTATNAEGQKTNTTASTYLP